MFEKKFQRRDIIKMGFGTFVAASIPMIGCGVANAALNVATNGSRAGRWSVSMRHTHTGETFSSVYRVGNKYLPHAFEKLNYFLRDFRTGDVFAMDPHVIDVISLVQAKTRHHAPLDIISGYRCPATNAMLHETTNGVATNSMHLYGKAIDIRMPGYNTHHLRQIAVSLQAGGVGYYPSSDFVHVDTGRVRYW